MPRGVGALGLSRCECLEECLRIGLYTRSECLEACEGLPEGAREPEECSMGDEDCPFLEEHG